MIENILQARFREYAPANALDQENILKETMQHYILANALDQQGPWAGTQPEVTFDWLNQALTSRIIKIDWQQARDDVQRFLPTAEQPALRNWEQPLFLYHAQQLYEQRHQKA